jgi:hypothetical protein
MTDKRPVYRSGAYYDGTEHADEDFAALLEIVYCVGLFMRGLLLTVAIGAPILAFILYMMS